MKENRELLKQIGLKIAYYGTLAVFALFATLPFLWMLITTFKQDADLYDRTVKPFFFNKAPTLVHLKELFLGWDEFPYTWRRCQLLLPLKTKVLQIVFVHQ